MTKGKAKGKYNSSATRVRPFFENLRSSDPSGNSWLQKLLTVTKNEGADGPEILRIPGPIVSIVFETEAQSELGVGPSEAFLRWLLQNPDQMVWPRGRTFSPKAERWRRALMYDTEPGRNDAKAEGLRELATFGTKKSSRRWWAFEGSTKVDCYIETENLRLYIEGKRTEDLSKATDWFPVRNQFVRNLESAREHAEGKPFACLLMSESPIMVTPDQIAAGLPHLTPAERQELMRHFLGNITWEEACKATGACFADLPDTCW